MSIKITFRGMDINTGEWVDGDLLSGRGDGLAFIVCGYVKKAHGFLRLFTVTETYQVDPKTVGQFTGLLDKNGVEIFEGDVVCHPWGYSGDSRVEGGIRKVEWLQEHNEAGFWISDLPDDCSWDDCEVIGSMHQNHELLEQK